MAAFYLDGLRVVPNHRSSPFDAAYRPYGPSNGHPSEEPDGLEVCRGFRNGVILEALAVRLVWAGWELTGRLAAWWRAW